MDVVFVAGVLAQADAGAIGRYRGLPLLSALPHAPVVEERASLHGRAARVLNAALGRWRRISGGRAAVDAARGGDPSPRMSGLRGTGPSGG